jgi:hypothetical protein
MIELIDLKINILSKPYELLKNASMKSVLDYFDSVINMMVGLYTGFLIFVGMCLFLFYSVIYRRLRRIMWNTNILLRVIPAAQCLDRTEQYDLS